MARKGWDELSPSYRKRLERSGIAKSQYERGEGDLSAARGHTSKRRENEDRQFWRLARRQLGDYFDDDEIREVVDDIGKNEALELLQMRALAMSPHDEMARTLGAAAMRVKYGQYEGIIPKQWLYYHRGK